MVEAMENRVKRAERAFGQMLLEMEWGQQSCEVKELEGIVDIWIGGQLEIGEVRMVWFWVLLNQSVWGFDKGYE